MRLLCFFFPRLPLQVCLRERPHLQDRPVVLLSGHGDEALVAAASSAASTSYVIPGMSAGQAHQRCPGAVFLPDNPGECLGLLERVAAMLRLRATPLVAVSGRDHLFVDLQGIPGEESAIAANLASLVRAWTGFEVHAGVAASRAVALEAARPARGLPAVLPPGRQAAEAPLEPFANRELSASLELPPIGSELVVRAAITRLLATLQPLLDGRRESFRTVRIDVEAEGGVRSLNVHCAQPLHRTLDAVDLLAGASELASLTDPSRVRVTLGRLGPDVRVRPCAAHRREAALSRQPLRAAG
jgi:hypothetical protein